MNTYVRNTTLLAFCSFLLILVSGCSSQRDTASTRKLQNLSARYNLIYNANNLLRDYEEGLIQSVSENYSTLLPLYHAPTMADATTAGAKVAVLDEIDQKARVIIAEKNFSNYIDEAYILLGKTNFYQGKYYNATAYFDYVAQAYQKNHDVYLNALNLKARSAIALNDLAKAAKILDTVQIELDSVKKFKSGPLATLAQFNMLKGNDKEAIVYLERALKAKPTGVDKIKWTYALAQLYENEKEYEKSLRAYHKVERSTAPFEMYFNARLSKIRINDRLKGAEFDRKQQLARMLRDDKNADFTDQIYYEIAEDYFDLKDYLNAEKNYNLAIANSTINKTQKALTYLKLADLNFKQYSNYVTAKLYYDSTLLFLPKTNLQYAPILTKSENLTYLKDRYEVITVQDTLQRIALLPEAQRQAALNQYFEVIQQGSNLPSTANVRVAGSNSITSINGGSFYFANSIAISKGYNEFKKRWGNRKLGDNWRQSVKTGSQKQQEAGVLDDALVSMASDPDAILPVLLDASSKSKMYLDSLPITPVLLERSNRKLASAFLEMGAFYQQVLKDNPEAIKTYETLLKRFPSNDKLDMVYYSLYLAYQSIDQAKSAEYKNLVLQKYPNSVFAKTIKDPNFSLKQNQLEVVLDNSYERLFEQLEQREFKSIISETDEIGRRFPGHAMEAQFDYLKAIAIGHTQNVDVLMASFAAITEKFKADKLITPLVQQHILYINANIGDFKKKKIALTRYNSLDNSFGDQNIATVRLKEPIIPNLQNPTGAKRVFEYIKPPEQLVEAKKVEKSVQKPVQKVEPTIVPKPEPKVEPKPAPAEIVIAKKKDSVITPLIAKQDSVVKPLEVPKVIETVVIPPEPVKDNLFNPASSETYYYVVAVNTVSVSISSSRFGIGQFNRGNYSGINLRHQLKELEKDQIIIVGDFANASSVSQYAANIKQQLEVIMKIPAANYSTFAISKENLAKITNSETLERYIRYINSNEL